MSKLDRMVPKCVENVLELKSTHDVTNMNATNKCYMLCWFNLNNNKIFFCRNSKHASTCHQNFIKLIKSLSLFTVSIHKPK